MKKWYFIFLIISILFFVNSFLFPILDDSFLFVFFWVALIYFYILWKRYPNYQAPLYLLFIFRYLFSFNLEEVILITFIMLSFYTLLVFLFDHFKIDRKVFINKVSYVEWLGLLIVIISFFVDVSFYYIVLLFSVVFMGIFLFYPFFLELSLFKLREKKVVVNNLNSFEHLYKIRNIIFTKTGVLTLGDYTLQEVFTSSPKNLWKYISYAEATKNDRIANFIRGCSEYQKVDLRKRLSYQEFDNGISYQFSKKQILVGNRTFLNEHGIEVDLEEISGTFIYVVQDNKVIGHIVLADKINLANKKVILNLRDLGIKHFVVFSKDQEKLTAVVSRTLGIRDSYGDLTLKKSNFWLYYHKSQYGDETALVSDNLVYGNVKVKIKFASNIKNNDNSDIIILEQDLNKCVDLFKLSKLLYKTKLSLIKMTFFGQLLLLVCGLLWFNKIWMVVSFSFIWMLVMLLCGAFKILKSVEE